MASTPSPTPPPCELTCVLLQLEGRHEALRIDEEGVTVKVPVGAEFIQSPGTHAWHRTTLCTATCEPALCLAGWAAARQLLVAGRLACPSNPCTFTHLPCALQPATCTTCAGGRTQTAESSGWQVSTQVAGWVACLAAQRARTQQYHHIATHVPTAGKWHPHYPAASAERCITAPVFPPPCLADYWRDEVSKALAAGSDADAASAGDSEPGSTGSGGSELSMSLVP